MRETERNANAYATIRELPVVASTTGSFGLDALCGRRQQERLRERVRARLNVQPSETLSFGHAGRARLEPMPVLACLRLLSLASPRAETFCDELTGRGVLGFAASQEYGAVTDRLLRDVQARSAEAPAELPLAGRINWVLSRLAGRQEQLRTWAQDQQVRWSDFSRDDPHFERLPGRLVREEGDEALVSVWNEAARREELRSLSAGELHEIGVRAEGDPFVLYDMTHIPGVRVSTVVPGVAPESETERAAQEEAWLRKHETPLPSVEALREEATRTDAAPLSGRRDRSAAD